MALPAGFPDATNTGWQSSPSYTGSLTTYSGATTLDPTANGTTYTNVDFQGLTVGTSTSPVDSITFQGCRFRSSWNTGWNVQVYGTSIVFDHCSFEPLNSQAVPVTYANSYQYGVDIRGSSSVTINACDIWGFGNAVQIETSSQSLPVKLQNSYIHDAADQDGSGGSGYHHDGFLSNNGGPQYVSITGNTIFSGGNTNAVALQSTGTAYDHITITGNLVGGFGYSVNIGDSYASGDTNVVFTDNTFTTNSPLPAYGPLKITWPTGGNNIWARNRWHYGGNGDPAADGKYWLPNGGPVTDWNNLSGWVSTTDYGSTGGTVTEYRTWPTTNGPSTDAADAAAYTMGTEFYTSQDAWVTKIHYYRGTTAVTAVVSGAVYDVGTSSLVANSTVTFADPGTATGWITGTLSTPLPITANKHYKAVVLYPNNYTSTANYWTSGAGSGGITNGILTVPNATAATGGGQNTYAAGATMAYPNTTFNGGCYWVDVSVSDTNPSTPTGTGTAIDPLPISLNRLAGTTDMDAQGAANVWAGTTGLALVGALNVKAGNSSHINMATNPSFETDTAGWVATLGTLTRDTTQAQAGTASGRFDTDTTKTGLRFARFPTVGATPGSAYTASVYMKLGTGSFTRGRVDLAWYDVNGVMLSVTTGAWVTLSSTAWTRVSMSDVAPAGTTGLQARPVFDPDPGATASAIYLDAGQIESGTSVTAYTEVSKGLLDLQGVLNQLAGTQGLGVDGAASRIVA